MAFKYQTIVVGKGTVDSLDSFKDDLPNGNVVYKNGLYVEFIFVSRFGRKHKKFLGPFPPEILRKPTTFESDDGRFKAHLLRVSDDETVNRLYSFDPEHPYFYTILETVCFDLTEAFKGDTL